MCNGFSCARMKAHCEMMELEEHTQHTFMSIRINVRHLAAFDEPLDASWLLQVFLAIRCRVVLLYPYCIPTPRYAYCLRHVIYEFGLKLRSAI